MNKSWTAILWGENGLYYREVGELITLNALRILDGETPPNNALLGVQPTLEEARVFGHSFLVKLKERRLTNQTDRTDV
jgi:hypothetical protein